MDRYDSFRGAIEIICTNGGIDCRPCRFPLIDKLVSLDEGKSLVSQCTLSVKDHPFLSDHAIDEFHITQCDGNGDVR